MVPTEVAEPKLIVATYFVCPKFNCIHFHLGCAKYILISVLASLVAFPVPITPPSASKRVQKSINFFLLVGSCVIGCRLGWLTWLAVVVRRRAFTACFTSSEEKAKNLLLIIIIINIIIIIIT